MKCGYFLIILAAIILFFLNRRHKRKQIEAMWLDDSGANVLDKWKYSPEEWKKFAEDDFRWVKNKNLPGEFSISDDSILISNGQDEFFRSLRNEWTLTAIEFRETTSIFRINLTRSRFNNSRNIYEYDNEDLWIPIPPENTERANRIVTHFHENMRTARENLKGATTNDLLFGQFLQDAPKDEKSDLS